MGSATAINVYPSKINKVGNSAKVNSNIIPKNNNNDLLFQKSTQSSTQQP